MDRKKAPNKIPESRKVLRANPMGSNGNKKLQRKIRIGNGMARPNLMILASLQALTTALVSLRRIPIENAQTTEYSRLVSSPERNLLWNRIQYA